MENVLKVSLAHVYLVHLYFNEVEKQTRKQNTVPVKQLLNRPHRYHLQIDMNVGASAGWHYFYMWWWYHHRPEAHNYYENKAYFIGTCPQTGLNVTACLNVWMTI